MGAGRAINHLHNRPSHDSSGTGVGGCPQRHSRSLGQSQVTELSSFIHITSIRGCSGSFCVDDLSVFEASLRGGCPVTPLYLRRGARLGGELTCPRSHGWARQSWAVAGGLVPAAPQRPLTRAARTDPASPALDAEESARGGGHTLERRGGRPGPSPAPPGVLREAAGEGTRSCVQGSKAAASPRPRHQGQSQRRATGGRPRWRVALHSAAAVMATRGCRDPETGRG